MSAKNKYPGLLEISKSVGKGAGLDKNICLEASQKMFEKIRDLLLQNKQVRLKEFGGFSLTKWNTKEVYNINSGEKQNISIRTIKFSASDKLKEKIRG